jgi:FtsP/CotA-like multicopper oxidase with cupredoxin domain
VREGARVQIAMTNRSMMPHPMHLHGHTGILRVPGVSSAGFAKDTVLLNPMDTATLEFAADNPGRWLFHCHNLYHMELGMARVVEYR